MRPVIKIPSLSNKLKISFNNFLGLSICANTFVAVIIFGFPSLSLFDLLLFDQNI